MATSPRRRVKWTYGDIFAVPLCDGSFGVCQAVYDVFTHVADCAFFSFRLPELPRQAPALNPKDIISLTAVWKNPLRNGAWPKIGYAAPILPVSAFPNQRLLRKANGVGVHHCNEALIEHFLSAWHALMPWNTFFEEDYLDKMLAPGVARPPTAIVLDPAARAEWREREQRKLEGKRAALTAPSTRTRPKPARAG